MQVCVDTTALALSGAGVRRVLAETSLALATPGPEGPSIAFFPFSPRQYAGGGHGRDMQPLRRLVRPPLERALFSWTRWRRPAIDRFLEGASLYQISEYIPYPVRQVRQIAIVHDLVALRHPEWCAPGAVFWQRQRLEHIAAHCVHVIVPSEPVRQSWLAYSGWRSERVSVVPWGVDPDFHRRGLGEIEHVKDRLRLRNPYLLHLGTVEPRKNLPLLLHAFERASKKFSRPLDLVLAGPRGWKTDRFDDAVAYTSVRDRVHRLGAVSEEFLPALISGASAVVMASYEEGFGLAALEGLACGTPVLSTQCLTLPEDLRPYCQAISAADEEGLAGALVEVVADPERAKRIGAEAAPKAQAMTWEGVADRLRRIYRELL